MYLIFRYALQGFLIDFELIELVDILISLGSFRLGKVEFFRVLGMTFSCSSVRLRSSTYFASDYFVNNYNRNGVLNARRCNVVSKILIFGKNLRVGRSDYCWGKKRGEFSVRSELQHSAGSDLSDAAIDVGDVLMKKESKVNESNYRPDVDNGGNGYVRGSSGDGDFPPRGGGGGGGGGDGDHNDGSEEDDEFGQLLKFEDVIREIEARGTSLPKDMLEAAKTVGLREVLLSRYLELQVLINLKLFAECEIYVQR